MILTPLVGLGRTFGRTAAAMTLDLASGAARLGEAAVDTATGRRRSLGVLRVQVLVLRDESGTPLADAMEVQPALDEADRVLRLHAGVRIRVLGVRVADAIPPPAALDPRANRALLLDEVLGRIDFYRRHLPAGDPSPGDGLIGSPVTVVVVRNIDGHTTGCSLGMSADWVIAQASLFHAHDEHRYDETVLAHELGHAMNLPHHRDRSNLMFGESSPPDHLRGTDLTGWQRGLIHANRHVIPGRSGDDADLG